MGKLKIERLPNPFEDKVLNEIGVKITESEKITLDMTAARYGMTLEEFVRCALDHYVNYRLNVKEISEKFT